MYREAARHCSPSSSPKPGRAIWCKQMSGGQRQAVAIARTRLSKPDIVLMDEPTAAISVRQVAEVLDLIRRLRDQGIAVILISHRMPDVFAVCDRIARDAPRHQVVADKPIRDDLARRGDRLDHGRDPNAHESHMKRREPSMTRRRSTRCHQQKEHTPLRSAARQPAVLGDDRADFHLPRDEPGLRMSFFTEDNFFNITRNFSFIGIIALGMTAVIMTGGIDLSVGSVVGCRAW